MVRCCVPYCKSGGKNKSSGVTFHEFPSSDSIKQKWLAVLDSLRNYSEQEWQPSDRTVVCSLHFADSDFKPGLKIRKLVQGAVPSIFSRWPRKQRKVSKPRRISEKFVSVPGSTTHSDQVAPAAVVGNNDPPKQNGVGSNSATRSSPVHNLGTQNDTGKTVFRETKDSSVSTIITIARMNETSKKNKVIRRRVQRLLLRVTMLETAYAKMKNENEVLRRKLEDANIEAIENECKVGNLQAEFLAEQLKYFQQKKPRWSDKTMKYCTLLHKKSLAGYRFIQGVKLLNLPSRTTLKRYIGAASLKKALTLVEQGPSLEDAEPMKTNSADFLITDDMCDEAVSHCMKGDDTEKSLETEVIGSLVADGMCNEPSTLYVQEEGEVIELASSQVVV